MSSPALQWFSGEGLGRNRSRGMAAVLAIAVNLGFLYFFALSFRLSSSPESPQVESILIRLIDRPRGHFREANLRTFSVHLNRPALRIPDTPPNVRIDVPLEAPAVQQRSDIRASLPPGIKDRPGADSSRGITEEPGEGKGAAVLHEVGPVYGRASVKSHEQGVVALRVLVDEQGRPRQVGLVRSSGFPRLDKSAINAVQRYRFTPPTSGSRAGQPWTTVKMEFDLLPMPVPTTIVGFDSVVAKQIAGAKPVDIDISPIRLTKTTKLVDRFADHLLSSISRDPTGERDPGASSSPTPLQVLASEGRPKSVLFVGYASRGFDCGSANLPDDSGNFRCEIFKVRHVRGTSYWLAAMANDGTVLRSIAISVAPGLR